MDDELLTGVAGAVAVGIGATAAMDLWAMQQMRLLGVSSLDYLRAIFTSAESRGPSFS